MHGEPDLLARVPGLEPPFNPVLVEIACLRARIDRKVDRLADLLIRGRFRLALLVSLNEMELQTVIRSGRAIVQVSLAELEHSPDEALRELRKARNVIIHGSI